MSHSSPSDDMEKFRQIFKQARHIVILTGAGVSAESGVPTFRGAGGLWRTYSAMDLATPQAFRSNSSLVWEFYHYRREVMAVKQPNKAHISIAECQKRLKTEDRKVSVITQNIDELHQRAGSFDVIELHGSLFRTRCLKCKSVEVNHESPICEALRDKGKPDPNVEGERIPEALLPRCKKASCRGLLRPDVVWFHENLNPVILQKTQRELDRCDLCLVIGTSSVVYPAAMFAPQVAERGVPVAEFNMETTPATHHFGFHFQGLAGDKKNRVLIFVNFDVDAICACRILQYLLLCDTVSYSIIPVQSKGELLSSYKESAEQASHVIFVNCGGTVDLVDLLEPSEEKIFFVADSHRPYDVCNIYNDGQVYLLGKSTEKEGIPSYEDIFGNDEDDSNLEENDEEDQDVDEDEEGNVIQSRAKRQKLDPTEAVLRRREKRMWEEKRKEILFSYLQFTYYSSSTALLMFELAWKLSRDSNDLLWWAVVGVAEQQFLGKVESKTSVMDNGKLQSHMIRLAHLSQQGDSTTTKDALYITHEKDLSLTLYRHWSLLESLKYSPLTACHFQLWTLKGEKKLNEFLAELGLPLSQCRQKYGSMDIELRNDLRSIFQKKVEKYDLDELIEYAFNSQYGFRPKNTANDFVCALIALLDTADKDKDPHDAFHDALECLSKSKMESLYKGMDSAKSQHVAIGKEVHTCLDMGHVINAGSCLYAVIQDGTPDARFYGHPHSLLLFGRFLLKAHISRARGRGLRARELPLIVSAPSAHRPNRCLLLGLPPVAVDTPKNLMGKAFEQAAENTQTEITSVYFDSSVIEINSEDRSRLLDSLFSLLE